MMVVTNTYENKTAPALAEISPNLIGVEPTTDGIKAGLREAAACLDDAERRASGAAVSWSSDWSESFDDTLMGQVGAFLDGC
jgi:hypothetical protein